MAKKRNGIITALLVLSVLVVVFNAIRAEYSPYNKVIARMGTYVNSIETRALIVRDEAVVESVNGVLEPSVKEGERVSAYSRIGAVVTGNIDEEKMNELNRLNVEIDNLTRNMSEAGVLTIEEDKIDSTLELSLDNLRYYASKQNVKSAISMAGNVKVLVERKSGATSSTIASEKLRELTNKRDSIARSLGGTHQNIYAPKAGLYSQNMDGLEEYLTFDSLKSVKPETVDKYFEATEEKNARGLCKIINNYKWYILCNLNEAECEGLKVDGEYAVAFKDLGEKEIRGTVEYISEPDADGRRAVTMRFDKYIDNFTTARVTSIEICKEKYSGIYIPASALRVHQGTLGVWVQNEISLDFRSISEVYKTDDFVLVNENASGANGHKNIVLYDNIVINPDDK